MRPAGSPTWSTERCPDAIRCADPFHVVSWATRALDDERRRAWNDAGRWPAPRANGRPGAPPKGARPGHERVRKLQHARYALWKNPEDLTEHQTRQAGLDRQDRSSATPGLPTQRGPAACLFGQRDEGKQALDRWISWARRCRIPAIRRAGPPHRQTPTAIEAALDHGLSQGLIESVNTKIRLLARIAFGFRSPQALIALAMLALGGYRPSLPAAPPKPCRPPAASALLDPAIMRCRSPGVNVVRPRLRLRALHAYPRPRGNADGPRRGWPKNDQPFLGPVRSHPNTHGSVSRADYADPIRRDSVRHKDDRAEVGITRRSA